SSVPIFSTETRSPGRGGASGVPRNVESQPARSSAASRRAPAGRIRTGRDTARQGRGKASTRQCAEDHGGAVAQSRRRLRVAGQGGEDVAGARGVAGALQREARQLEGRM